MAGIERADSIVLDPHKGLFLPYGTGALLVRDGETLRRAHALTADYLPENAEDPELPDFLSCRPSSRATSAACASGCRSRCTASGRSAATSTRSSP